MSFTDSVLCERAKIEPKKSKSFVLSQMRFDEITPNERTRRLPQKPKD
jgi:hypothetical protein